MHTEVDPGHEGAGLGSALAEARSRRNASGVSSSCRCARSSAATSIDTPSSPMSSMRRCWRRSTASDSVARRVLAPRSTVARDLRRSMLGTCADSGPSCSRRHRARRDRRCGPRHRRVGQHVAGSAVHLPHLARWPVGSSRHDTGPQSVPTSTTAVTRRRHRRPSRRPRTAVTSTSVTTATSVTTVTTADDHGGDRRRRHRRHPARRPRRRSPDDSGGHGSDDTQLDDHGGDDSGGHGSDDGGSDDSGSDDHGGDDGGGHGSDD